MKIGISTASFFTKEVTENTFEIIEKLGIDTCEVFLTTFMEYEEDFIRLLKKRKGTVDIYSVHTLNVQFEPELFNSVKRTRNDCEVFFKKIAVAANILDAKYYTFHGLTKMKRVPYTIDFQKVGKRVDELNKILYSVSGEKCKLAYEN
ncbi:MAG: sugar phosphate isomerase/epimerase family protein, partial [Bacillota bacterium]